MAKAVLEAARAMFLDNVDGITLEDALDSAGGYRSILGLIKHSAAWSSVYWSFAFESEPKGWAETDWPGGLRERIEPTERYLADVIAWFRAQLGSMARLDGSVGRSR